MNTIEIEKHFTVPEVAAVVRLRPFTVRRLCRDGRLDGVRPSGNGRGPWLISESAIARYFQRARRVRASEQNG